MPVWRAVIVERDGTPLAEIENARIRDVALRHTGELDTALIQFPTTDANGRFAQTIRREMQVWWGDTLLVWGPIIRRRITRDLVSCQIASPDWYLDRRIVGDPDRTNLLVGAGVDWSFETGPAGDLTPPGWTNGNPLTGASQQVADVDVIDTGGRHAVHGDRYVRLEDGAGHNGFLMALITPPAAGIYLNADAFALTEDAGYTGPAYGDRGLVLDVVNVAGTVSYAQAGYPLPGRSRRDVWHRAEATVFVPHGSPSNYRVQVRLYGCGGRRRWDAVRLHRNEALFDLEADVGDVVAGLIGHAQDPAYGKDDVNLTVDSPPLGFTVQEPFRHADHAVIGEALRDLSDGDDTDGFDYAVTYAGLATPPTRTLKVWHPRRGVLRPDLRLEYGRNIAEFLWDEDGDATRNSLLVQGHGHSAFRDEAGARDTADLGVVLEGVIDGPRRAEVYAALDRRARSELRLRKRLVYTPRVTTHEGASDDILGVVRPGDRLPVSIDHGALEVDDTFQVVELHVDPQTNKVTLALNVTEV